NQSGTLGGRAGATDCAMRSTGINAQQYAGMGVNLEQAGILLCGADATEFTGIQFWVKGSSTNTYGLAYQPAPNTLRIQIITMMDDTGFDEYGFWCTMNPDTWSLCGSSFADLKQEGWGPKASPFDKSQVRTVNFMLKHQDGTDPINFDFWID